MLRMTKDTDKGSIMVWQLSRDKGDLIRVPWSYVTTAVETESDGKTFRGPHGCGKVDCYSPDLIPRKDSKLIEPRLEDMG